MAFTRGALTGAIFGDREPHPLNRGAEYGAVLRTLSLKVVIGLVSVNFPFPISQTTL